MLKYMFSLLLLFLGVVFSGENYATSVVKIVVIKNEYSYDTPWNSPSQILSGGSGFLIEDEYIITNAHVIADAVAIYVQKDQEGMRYEANVEYVDHDCDLAALRVSEKKFYKNMQAFSIADNVEVGKKIQVLGYPMLGENLCITEGIISRREITQYTHSGKLFEVMQVDSAVNGGNSGGPAIAKKEKKVVGVVHQAYTQGQNINHIIPIIVLRHFLYDLQHKDFSGFPECGIHINNLLNPVKQEYYHLTDTEIGVLISSIDFQSCAENILFPDDVILEIDNFPIRNDGMMILPNKEVMTLKSFLCTKHYGENVKIKILREGQEKIFFIQLRKNEETKQPLIPKIQYGTFPTYYIFGGFVFQPLTENYLFNCSYIDENYYSYLHYLFKGKKTSDKTQIIIISSILSDNMNYGYEGLDGGIVAEVNGKMVKNIRHLVKLLEHSLDPFVIITTDKAEKILLSREDVLQNQEEILERYQIPSDRSRDLENI